jgi:hypothetical protein
MAKALEMAREKNRFGEHFEIERIAGEIDYSKFPLTNATLVVDR